MVVPQSVRDPGGKREAILDAALALFADRGFHGTAVPAVAEAAKVGAGTLYRYFDGKEALVNAVYQREKLRFVELLMAEFPMDRPPREQFGELWRRLWRFAERHPKSAVFLELHHHGEYLDAESRALEARVMEPILAFVRLAQDHRALKKLDPQLLVAVVYGAFIQVARAAWMGQLSPDERTLEAAENCLWEAVRL